MTWTTSRSGGGGADEDANRQAVCVACHRQKTGRERVERSSGEAPDKPPAAPVVGGEGAICRQQ